MNERYRMDEDSMVRGETTSVPLCDPFEQDPIVITTQEFRQTIAGVVQGFDDVTEWKAEAIPPQYNTLELEAQRAHEEFVELGVEVLLFDGSKESEKKIAEEATDVVIRMMGIIALTGHDIAKLLEEKVEVMFEKYSIDKLNEYQANGLSWPDAMAQAKKEWNEKNTS